MELIKGIIPPMITPLTNDGKLDHNGLKNTIEHILNGGVHGLFILGTTGEGPSLPYKLRHELIEKVCNQVDNRVPVLVGISDSSLKESLNVSKYARKCGANAVVLAPPFYYKITQTELFDYLYTILKEIPLPVYLYNQPSLTKIDLELEVIEEFLSRPEVAGFKDSSGDMIYFQKLNRLCKKAGIPLLCGPEELLVESLMARGDGGIPGGANLFPALYREIYDAVSEKKYDKALNLNKIILRISDVVYSGGKYGSGGVINGLKYALKLKGICNEYVSLPLGNIKQDKANEINHFLQEEFKDL